MAASNVKEILPCVFCFDSGAIAETCGSCKMEGCSSAAGEDSHQGTRFRADQAPRPDTSSWFKSRLPSTVQALSASFTQSRPAKRGLWKTTAGDVSCIVWPVRIKIDAEDFSGEHDGMGCFGFIGRPLDSHTLTWLFHHSLTETTECCPPRLARVCMLPRFQDHTEPKLANYPRQFRCDYLGPSLPSHEIIPQKCRMAPL